MCRFRFSALKFRRFFLQTIPQFFSNHLFQVVLIVFLSRVWTMRSSAQLSRSRSCFFPITAIKNYEETRTVAVIKDYWLYVLKDHRPSLWLSWSSTQSDEIFIPNLMGKAPIRGKTQKRVLSEILSISAPLIHRKNVSMSGTGVNCELISNDIIPKFLFNIYGPNESI